MLQKYLIIVVPLLFSLLISKKRQQEYVIHGFAQGTDYTIRYFAPENRVNRKAIDSVLNVIDGSMSLYHPASAISRFNASPSGIKLDEHFLMVMEHAFRVCKDTHGIFDVTVAPLVQAWGFGARPINKFPDSNVIRSILPCTGMQHLSLKRNFLYKDAACVQVDLNGIAQGYTVDVLARLLLKKKIKSFIIELGGEIRVNGPKPDGTGFKVGVEGPGTGENGAPFIRKILTLNKGAVTTSGNYRKFLQQGPAKISHLINPATGYPLNNEMISVTIVAPDAVTADGYDNALMGMGLSKAMEFLKVRKRLEAYIIYKRKDGSVADTLTAGFKKMLIN